MWKFTRFPFPHLAGLHNWGRVVGVFQSNLSDGSILNRKVMLIYTEQFMVQGSLDYISSTTHVLDDSRFWVRNTADLSAAV